MPVQEDTVQCVIEAGLDGPKTRILTNPNILCRWKESGKSKTMRLTWACITVILVVCIMAVTTVETKKRTPSVTFSTPSVAITRPESPSIRKQKVQEGGKSKRPLIDPRSTWNTFQRLADRNEKMERKKAKATARQLKSGPIYTQGPPGPPGPRGLRGLRGPKGGNFTKEEVLEIIRQVFKQREAISQGTAASEVPQGNPQCNETHAYEGEEERGGGNSTETVVYTPCKSVQKVFIPQISVAFMWELPDDVVVQRKSFTELKKFHRATNGGGYERHVDEFSSEAGRFIASRSGFYTFFVRLHLLLRASDGESISNLGNELFSVLLCIESLCQKNVNLETISGFPVGQRTTVSINGMFQLEVNQYVSVFIDNSSRYSIKIFHGSQFSGHLSGV